VARAKYLNTAFILLQESPHYHNDHHYSYYSVTDSTTVKHYISAAS